MRHEQARHVYDAVLARIDRVEHECWGRPDALASFARWRDELCSGSGITIVKLQRIEYVAPGAVLRFLDAAVDQVGARLRAGRLPATFLVRPLLLTSRARGAVKSVPGLTPSPFAAVRRRALRPRAHLDPADLAPLRRLPPLPRRLQQALPHARRRQLRPERGLPHPARRRPHDAPPPRSRRLLCAYPAGAAARGARQRARRPLLGVRRAEALGTAAGSGCEGASSLSSSPRSDCWFAL